MPDELERLRALFEHAHDPKKVSSVRKFLLQITARFVHELKQPKPKPTKHKDAA